MRPSYSSSTIIALLALAADAFAAPSPAAQPNGQTMRLSRRTVDRTYDEWGAWAKSHREGLMNKYNGGNNAKARTKRGSGTNLIVNQNADSTYFGSLAVGTPPIAFDVILDTGSAYVAAAPPVIFYCLLHFLVSISDLWIADTTCSSRSGCQDITTFDASKSSSFRNLSRPFSITYGSGAAAGSLAEDVVQMAGFSVSNQTFALVDQVSSQLLTAPVSGLMGLAFQSIASSGATPFWQNLVESGAWDSPVMSFQLTRFVDQQQAQSLEAGGTFTLGFVNNSLYTGDIDFQNIPGGTGSYWILQMSELTVQGNSVALPSGSSSYAAIDTGTTLVGGPSSVISNFYSQIPGAQAGTGNYEGYWIYPCSTQVTTTMAFGGKSWTISPADFLLTQLSTSQCLGAFFELDMGAGSSAPSWIVGDTFLKNVYSVFRYNPPSIGFANLSSTALAMNGDLNAVVPTPTLGSAAAAITATGRTRSSGTSAAMPSVEISGVVVVFVSLLAGIVALL
ncbi:acid protease [Fomitiporia mediterranea MF3/22]|uniref:acid protease n=1 Tax=Fomitiporia mediterranea (strain MF3/22) TaxID=694068 RepID=UPI000440855E|nr:acid protease [Fomitiporia mediterranea MF3/22]EJD07583.1 acid protease [Fomitiporia mediterranea MF3/22]